MSRKAKLRKELDQEVVKRAIKNFKINNLASEMGRVGWSQETVAELAYYLQSASGLIIRYPDATKSSLRDAFLASVRALVTTNLSAEAHLVHEALEQIRIAEDGFTRLFQFTTETPWNKLPPASRVAALIERATDEIKTTVDAATSQLMAARQFNMVNPTIRDPENRPVDAEAPTNIIVSGLSASLMMVAHQAGWFQGDTLILPELPPVTQEQVEVAGAPLYLAAGWSRWERIEEHARLIGPNLEELGGTDLPEGMPSDTERAYKYQHPDRLWYNEVATWRYLDRIRQTRAELARDGRIPPLRLLKDRPTLAPGSVVTESEFISYIALCERLGVNIGESNRLIKGLKLTEWLRGFSTLSVMADQKYEANRALSQVWTQQEILRTLTSAGLSSDKAAIFVGNVTVHKNTRDLFDAPLITLDGHRYLVLMPTVMDTFPHEVMMSVFSELKVQFDGKPFEGRVIQLLKDNGVHAEQIKFRVDREEYDCDVVCVWGEQVLLFECKNKSLPGSRATHAHYFDQELLGDIHQVTRLRDALISNPDQLDRRFGPGTSKLPITRIVLRNAPYSRRGAIDGVYFYDFSALARFFKSKNLQVSTGPQKGPFTSVAYATLWVGDRPVVSDLLKEIADPTQLRINDYHTRKLSLVQGLDAKTVALTEIFIREEMDDKTLIAFRDHELSQVSGKQIADVLETN